MKTVSVRLEWREEGKVFVGISIWWNATQFWSCQRLEWSDWQTLFVGILLLPNATRFWSCKRLFSTRYSRRHGFDLVHTGSRLCRGGGRLQPVGEGKSSVTLSWASLLHHRLPCSCNVRLTKVSGGQLWRWFCSSLQLYWIEFLPQILPGCYGYKFFVDGEWKNAPGLSSL